MKRHQAFIIVASLLPALAGCASMKSMLAIKEQKQGNAPIAYPFDMSHEANQKENIILRTKKGDRAVEVEIPPHSGEISDLAMPVTSSEDHQDTYGIDERYKGRRPGISDREIASALPTGSGRDEIRRREIEGELGLKPSDDPVPAADQSYLGAIDRVKQLFRNMRYEAALLETDELLRLYPTDAKLYEMRGTLFDRIGRSDLAIRSWKQALRLDPTNVSLKRFIERREQTRRVASP